MAAGVAVEGLVAKVLGEVGHFDGGFGSLGTFVAQGAAGTIDGLLQVVGGEDAEDDGHLLRRVQVGATLGGAVAHIVEVRCAAADDAADHDDGVIAARARHLSSAKGQFHSAGHMSHGDVFVAFSLEQVKSALQQRACDLVIPFSADDAHGEAVHMGEGVKGV